MLMSISVLVFSVFISSYQSSDDLEDEKIEYQDVSAFLWDNVYPELDVLTPNSYKRSFSRCPSGFSQSLDEEKTGDTFAFGTIFNADGCYREEFCDYKVNMIEKLVYLKNLDEKEYVAMDEYIAMEKDKKTAKF